MLTLIIIVAAAVAIGIVANWKLQFFKWDLMDEIKKFDRAVGGSSPEPRPEVTVEITDTAARVETSAASVNVETKPQRARNSQGKFVGDDPATVPVNEAWVGGAAPAKKTAKRSYARRTAKKT